LLFSSTVARSISLPAGLAVQTVYGTFLQAGVRYFLIDNATVLPFLIPSSCFKVSPAFMAHKFSALYLVLPNILVEYFLCFFLWDGHNSGDIIYALEFPSMSLYPQKTVSIYTQFSFLLLA
jgi:hypothetical protein